MAKRFTPKIKVLTFIEQKEIVGAFDLVNQFPMTLERARNRLTELKKARLMEPLGIERGKWVLSIEGYRMLEYHRKRRGR